MKHQSFHQQCVQLLFSKAEVPSKQTEKIPSSVHLHTASRNLTGIVRSKAAEQWYWACVQKRGQLETIRLQPEPSSTSIHSPWRKQHLHTGAHISHGSRAVGCTAGQLRPGDAKGQAAGRGRQRKAMRTKEGKPANLFVPNASIFSFQKGNYQRLSCVLLYAPILRFWLNDSLVLRTGLYKWEAFTSIWYTNSSKKHDWMMKIQDFELLLHHLSKESTSLCRAERKVHTGVWNKLKS